MYGDNPVFGFYANKVIWFDLIWTSWANDRPVLLRAGPGNCSLPLMVFLGPVQTKTRPAQNCLLVMRQNDNHSPGIRTVTGDMSEWQSFARQLRCCVWQELMGRVKMSVRLIWTWDLASPQDKFSVCYLDFWNLYCPCNYFWIWAPAKFQNKTNHFLRIRSQIKC